MNDWLRVTAIGGDDYECRMTVLKADDTTITITRPWHHHWTDGWNWKTIIRQWLSDVPETFEPYDGLAEWLRDAFALAASNEFGTVPPHRSRVSGSP